MSRTPSRLPRPEPSSACEVLVNPSAQPPLCRHRAIARAAWLLASLTALALGAPSARAAASPCGGLQVADGFIAFGEAQRVADARSDAMEACLDAVALELRTRPGLRSITVAARVAGSPRAGSTAP